MQNGGQGCGYSHDQTEVNVFGIFPPGGILYGLNGPVGILGTPVGQGAREQIPKD